jgi:hypothetical protein
MKVRMIRESDGAELSILKMYTLGSDGLVEQTDDFNLAISIVVRCPNGKYQAIHVDELASLKSLAVN